MGRIKRGDGNILKQEKLKNGYLRGIFSEFGKTFRISMHRLVAKIFIKNPENKLQVNHINGIKDDNRAENLEWSTQSENMKHAYKEGLQKPIIGEDNKRSILTNSQVRQMRLMYETNLYTQKYLSDLFKIDSRVAQSILTYKTWKNI